MLIDVPDDVVTERISGRGREDDDPETVRERLHVYHGETEPLIEYYEQRDLLRRVDGKGDPATTVERALCARHKRWLRLIDDRRRGSEPNSWAIRATISSRVRSPAATYSKLSSVTGSSLSGISVTTAVSTSSILLRRPAEPTSWE